MTISAENFNTINDVYEYIDNNAYELTYSHEICNIWYKFRETASSSKEKQLAQWEVDFFSFSFRHHKVFPSTYSNGEKLNNIKPYPDIDKIETNVVDYLKLRALQSKNPLISSRYNHLLWKGVKGVKNRVHAIKAIDSYFKLIYDYIKFYNTHENFRYQIGNAFESVTSICKEIKHGVSELKKVTNFLLFKNKGGGFPLKSDIIVEMLFFPMIFKKEDFLKIISIFEKEAKNIERDDYLWISSYFPLAINVALKTNTDVKKWYNEIGLAYLRISELETDKSKFFIILNNYLKAIDAFTTANNISKKNRSGTALCRT